MQKLTRDQLEVKIMELENKKAEMEDAHCYILAEILEKQIDRLADQLQTV